MTASHKLSFVKAAYLDADVWGLQFPGRGTHLSHVHQPVYCQFGYNINERGVNHPLPSSALGFLSLWPTIQTSRASVSIYNRPATSARATKVPPDAPWCQVVNRVSGHERKQIRGIVVIG